MTEHPADPNSGHRRAVFLHGAGRSGAEAWPGQQRLVGEWDCLFLERLTLGDNPDVVVADLTTRLDAPVHLVGHSYGGITAMRLATARPDLVTSLTLVEPAALAVCTHAPHTAAHIAAFAPVFARADDDTVSAREFASLFAAANQTPVPDVTDEVLESLTRQLRALHPPWTVPVDATVVSSIPTLVVIGDDDGMYSKVAQVLATHTASVQVFLGAGHRPHDASEAADLMVSHWRRAEAAP